MASPKSASPGDDILRVATRHPEFVGGEVIGDDEVRIDLRVEMPLHCQADGISDTGVRIVEPVTLRIPSEYPWRSPQVRLRADFPRNFPHLHPGGADAPPRPCLVDGDQDEFFLQFGLVEYGVFHLLEQVAVWLRKAAINHLIDPVQGWEPAMRRGLRDTIAFDAETMRATRLKAGGYIAWRGRFGRTEADDATLLDGASVWINSDGGKTPLSTTDKSLFSVSPMSKGGTLGKTVIGIVWADKPPSGGTYVSDRYTPDDVTTIDELRAHADTLGCRRGLDLFLSNLERSWQGWHLNQPIPIGIVLCVERPVHLIGSNSPIELLPYVVEIRPYDQRTTAIVRGGDEPVRPALHYQTLNAPLLRTLAGVPERPALALLGCGSVGSKLALHAARSGQSIIAISDEGWLRPHNMARHALFPTAVGQPKTAALADELAGFSLSPTLYQDDIASALRDEAIRVKVIPAGTGIVVNATASLAVREALSTAIRPHDRARYIEAALFGRGRMAYLLVGGASHNPNHNDLMAEMYATLADGEAVALLADPETGLAEIQIGQGCGSLTMTIDDAQLSMMTAGLAKEIDHAADHPNAEGLIVTGVCDIDTPATRWTRQTVPSFETVAIEGTDGWELRISQRIAAKIRSAAAASPHAETGGLLIGLSSARMKTVTVVDLLDAPADSTFSAGLFVLGTTGLQDAIEHRHQASGRTLFDVGTWHSHLADEGPSPLDWRTATELAAGRTPPSVLLIVTPLRFHALIAKDTNGG